jgi:hypothetical protein
VQGFGGRPNKSDVISSYSLFIHNNFKIKSLPSACGIDMMNISSEIFGPMKKKILEISLPK